MFTETLKPMAARGSAVGAAFLPSLAWGLLAVVSTMAADTTNVFTSVSNYPSHYEIIPATGNSQKDIWAQANGASFTVTGALCLGRNAAGAGYGGIATLILDGSTNYVRGIGSVSSRALATGGSGTSVISLVNNAMLALTTDSVNYVEFNTYRLGVLSLTNSTLVLQGSGSGIAIDYNGGGGGVNSPSTNRLLMLNSTINAGNQSLSIGGAGGYGDATIQNSVLTNVNQLNVGGAAGYGFATISDSSIHTMGAYTMVIGAGAGRMGSLRVDHTTWAGGGSYAYMGYTTGTGLFSLVNGSVISHPNVILGLGRSGGTALLTVSNSTFNTARDDLGGWISAIPTEIGGKGTILLHDGTNNASTRICVGAATNASGYYTAEGASRVATPSLVVGYSGGSTGIFTMADSTVVAVTNAGGTANITVGDVGKGTFTITGVGGAVTANTFTAGSYDSTLKFVLTTNGITPLNITGLMNVKTGAKLVIDATLYKQAPALVLANYGSRTGSFDPTNITIIGREADVTQTATRMTVKILGIGTVIFIL